MLVGAFRCGIGNALHFMEGQLRGLTDDLGGLARVLDARQFDDDAPFARSRQRGLGDTQGIDASAQDFERPVG